MTPNDIEILLHFHCTAAPHPRGYAPAVQEAIAHFVSEAILKPTDQKGSYATTQRGEALVAMLCATPLPVVVSNYADPRTGELIK